jgi:putative DNA primase/helicase
MDYFDFAPTHKLWLACNHKPHIRGTDHGIWRRIRLIPFNVTIPDDNKDPHLLDKLTQELPGILRWAVEGAMAWKRQGLDPPKAVVEATDRYRVESDLVGQFLEDCCVSEAYARVRSTMLYSAYQSWCTENGITHPLSQKGLAKQLEGKDYDRSSDNRQHQVWWVGLGLRDADRPEVAGP